MKDLISVEFFSPDTAGIYESLKTYDGVLFRPEEHLDRFFDSAKTVGLRVPKSREEIRRELKKAVSNSKNKNVFVRLTLIGTPQVSVPALSIIVTERKHPPAMYQKGVLLKTTPVRRNDSNQSFPEAKSTTACLNQVLATLEPQPAGNYELVFLNREGYLTEARIGNFFIVKSRCLFTPPPVGLLNGVTRRFVIECARLGKIPVEERFLTRHELFTADEAFLTNTSWEILPIREVDSRRVGQAVPGPVTQKLRTIFKKQVLKEIRSAKN